MKATFPKTVTVPGIPKLSATIYRNRQDKTLRDQAGNVRTVEYVNYTLAYPLLGKLKRETFADLDKAEAAGAEAIKRMANDEVRVLQLSNRDADEHLRAKDILKPLGISLDAAATECVDLRAILNGIATPMEAARFFVQAHSKKLPRITVPDAVTKCLAQARADGKSKVRMHELDFYLTKFAESMQVEVGALTPSIVSQYLTGLEVSERTKANCRAVLAYFGRWLVLRGYLERGTNLLENVQRYSKRSGAIHIFSPGELSRLIEKCSDELLPYIAIGAFAGLRGAEILRLDWSEIELLTPKPEDKEKDYGYIEVKAEKSKTDVRRLVPIKANLAAWLKPIRKTSGLVCSLKSISNYFLRLVAAVNKDLPKGTDPMKWRKNALRHSCISYRIAECADVARVADESGNSPAIIKANYLKRVKPAQAAEWFGIMPAGAIESGKVTSIRAN